MRLIARSLVGYLKAQVEAGARHITFGDPDFLNGPTHARRLSEELHRAFPKLTWDFTAKVEHLLAHRVETVAIWIYIALGWIPIVTAFSLVGLVPNAGLWWMLIGGLCYTVGTVFLIFDNHVRHFHALWHLFVIAGSACHFFVILLFVAPLR